MRKLIRLLFFASLILLAMALWLREALPAPKLLRQELYDEPVQTAYDAAPFDTRVGGIEYRIQPRFRYELYGLVVSRHDAAVWWDYAHKEWNDNLNVVDLCVVWGNNLRRGAYRAVSYSHDQWTCWYETGSSEAWHAFDTAAISNNHLITDDPRIAEALRQARIGDQVHVRGYLADYTTFRAGAPAGTRVSSIVRTDAGNGACEIVYVEAFEIVKAGGGIWRQMVWLAGLLLAGSVLAWFFLPARFYD